MPTWPAMPTTLASTSRHSPLPGWSGMLLLAEGTGMLERTGKTTKIQHGNGSSAPTMLARGRRACVPNGSHACVCRAMPFRHDHLGAVDRNESRHLLPCPSQTHVGRPFACISNAGRNFSSTTICCPTRSRRFLIPGRAVTRRNSPAWLHTTTDVLACGRHVQGLWWCDR